MGPFFLVGTIPRSIRIYVPNLVMIGPAVWPPILDRHIHTHTHTHTQNLYYIDIDYLQHSQIKVFTDNIFWTHYMYVFYIFYLFFMHIFLLYSASIWISGVCVLDIKIYIIIIVLCGNGVESRNVTLLSGAATMNLHFLCARLVMPMYHRNTGLQ